MDLVKLFENAARRAGMTARRLDRNLPPADGVPPGLPEDVSRRMRERAKQPRNGSKAARHQGNGANK